MRLNFGPFSLTMMYYTIVGCRMCLLGESLEGGGQFGGRPLFLLLLQGASATEELILNRIKCISIGKEYS